MNAYAQLKKLLPEPKLAISTVSAVHGDGTVTVSAPGGQATRVRGTGSVGSNVFVRNGVVEGAAPSLTSSAISLG